MGFVDNVATSLVCLCLLLQYVCGAKHVDLTGFSAYDFSTFHVRSFGPYINQKLKLQKVREKQIWNHFKT